MTLKFEITGACTVPGAEHKPTEAALEAVIEQILADELDVTATIYVSNMREE